MKTLTEINWGKNRSNARVRRRIRVEVYRLHSTAWFVTVRDGDLSVSLPNQRRRKDAEELGAFIAGRYRDEPNTEVAFDVSKAYKRG